MTGMIKPKSGEIFFGEQTVTQLPMYKRARLGIGYLAQEPSVFRKMSVEQNLMAILELMPVRHSERKQRIEELIEPGSSVLDLGCGRGELLGRLMRRRNVRGLGVEVQQENICECIDRGIHVVDLDVEAELSSFADKTYDYVLLSQTLQTLRRPDLVLREMLRIGRRSIVSFPNFVYWKAVFQMILSGRTPVTENLPFRWYNTPNLHYLTIRDFQAYCQENQVRILKYVPLKEGRQRPLRILPSLRAEEAIFVIGNSEASAE